MNRINLLKIILTVSLLLFLIIKIPVSEIISVLSSLNPLLFIISALFVPIAYSIKAIKWNIVLSYVENNNYKDKDNRTDLLEILKIILNENL